MNPAPPGICVERCTTTGGIRLAARAGKEVEMQRRTECSCWSGQSNQRQGREQAKFAHAFACRSAFCRNAKKNCCLKGGSYVEKGRYGSPVARIFLPSPVTGCFRWKSRSMEIQLTELLTCTTGRLRAVRTPYIEEAHTPHTSGAIFETHTQQTIQRRRSACGANEREAENTITQKSARSIFS